jgi:hypothetical protein
MKAHVGVDSKMKKGDQAYRGQAEVIHECAPQVQDCRHRRYRYKDSVDDHESNG